LADDDLLKPANYILYVKDGLDIIIKNGWLERVPETANRKELRTTNN